MEMKPWVEYPGETVKLLTGCGSIYLTVVFDLDRTRPIELIVQQAGRGGSCVSAQLQLLSSAITTIFKVGDPYHRIKEYLSMTGTSCAQDNPRGSNCLHKIGHYLMGMELRNFSKGGE